PGGPAELYVGHWPALAAAPFHDPGPRLCDGPALQRPQYPFLGDLPGAVGAGPAPAFAAERLVAGPECRVSDRSLVSAVVEYAPVSGLAAQFASGRAGPPPPGVQPPDALGEDFNLSTSESTTVLQLAELIWRKITEIGRAHV